MKLLDATMCLILSIGLDVPAESAVATSEPAVIVPGKPVPDFVARDANNRTHRLSTYRGRTVVLEWTSPWCPFTRKHYVSGNIPSMQKWAKSNGVIWLSAISTARSSPEYVSSTKAQEMNTKRGGNPTALLMDETGQLGHLFGAKVTPTVAIIDPAGTLAYLGAVDDKPTTDPADIPSAHNYVRAALEDLRANHPVSTPISRPYGCRISYSR